MFSWTETSAESLSEHAVRQLCIACPGLSVLGVLGEFIPADRVSRKRPLAPVDPLANLAANSVAPKRNLSLPGSLPPSHPPHCGRFRL